MPRNLRAKCAISMTLVAMAVLLAAATALAYGPYTIRGQVTMPDGSPAANAIVQLVPHSGLGLDQNNDYWKIPGYQFHRVETDAAGNYLMTGVIDYPENTGHRYALQFDGPSKFYHGTTHVLLKGIDTNLTVNLKLTVASSLRINLTDAVGQPYNGTRAVYVETGTLGQGPIYGVSYITDASFVNGVAEIPRVVIKDKVSGAGLVAILQQSTAAAAKSALQKSGLRPWDTRDGLRYVVKQVDGAVAEQYVNYVPLSTTNVTLSL